MEYSIVIRTLGTGGEKYQKLLESIQTQTIQPKHLLIILPEGYSKPAERIGTEEYIFTHKGMWHQRVYGLEYAANLNDVEYILALDDDVSFHSNMALDAIDYMHANLCDILIHSLGNQKQSFARNLMEFILGSGFENPFQRERVKVIATGGFMVNNSLLADAAPTQSGSFNAFWIRSDKVNEVAVEEEYWLDDTRYALPDDQVFFYKCFLKGFKQHVHLKNTICHLDHGSSNPTRLKDIAFSSGRNYLIFWHRFLYNQSGILRRIFLFLALVYRNMMRLIVYIARRRWGCFRAYFLGMVDAVKYINTIEYQNLPQIKK